MESESIDDMLRREEETYVYNWMGWRVGHFPRPDAKHLRARAFREVSDLNVLSLWSRPRYLPSSGADVSILLNLVIPTETMHFTVTLRRISARWKGSREGLT